MPAPSTKLRASSNRTTGSSSSVSARLWANQVATQALVLRALQDGEQGLPADLEAKVIVAACLAAATTAVLSWTENDGTPELPDLVAQAFDILTDLRGPLQGREP